MNVSARCSDSAADYTKGVSYRNSNQWTGLNNVSLMGGIPIFIATSGGLDFDAHLNTIALKSKNLKGQTFVQPLLSGRCAVILTEI